MEHANKYYLKKNTYIFAFTLNIILLKPIIQVPASSSLKYSIFRSAPIIISEGPPDLRKGIQNFSILYVSGHL